MEPREEVDLLRYISLPINVLKFCGIWFYIPHQVNSMKFWSRVVYRIFIAIFVFVIPTGAQLIYLIKAMMGEPEVQEVAAIINLTLTELLTSFKLLDLYLRRHLLEQLIKQMNNEQFTLVSRAKLQALGQSIRFSRRLFMCLLVSAVFDVFVHVIVVPSLGGFNTLPMKMDFLFFNNYDYFVYVCAYQILYKPIMLLAFITLQSLSWSFMICAIGQLDVLIYKFENMKELVNAAKSEMNCDENEAFESIFKKCLQHHGVIKRFVTTIQATFGGQFSSMLVMSACIICTTAVQIISIESPRDSIVELIWVILYWTVFISILFVDCFLGNNVTIKSGLVSTAVYNCPWVNLSPKLKRNVLIFIAETQRPLVIRAGYKLVPVSLETYTTVMDWTYKGFALMNQMKH